VLLLGACLAALAALGAGAWIERRAVALDLATERDLHGAAYVGSAACRDCHPDNYRSWHRTFHRTMTQDLARAGAGADIVGDFSGAVYRYGGVTARMDRDARGAFRMSFSQGDPVVTRTAIISRAVGSRRYQQYLTRVAGEEYRLPMAFDMADRRWFHMNGAFLLPDPSSGVPAGDAAGTTPHFGGTAYDRHVTRWNDNCVFCHNVAPNPGRDARTGSFATTVAETGIACESCHGPGGEHARANRDPVRRYLARTGGARDPTIVNPSRLSPARSADVCGRCHGQRLTDDVGRFLERGDPFVPGDDLALYSEPLWQETALRGQPGAFAARFWDDGTARLTAYEYQGLLQSACAQRGALTCTSCHGMHDGNPRGQLRPPAAGDGACTGCHAAIASAADKGRHARHDPAGPGGRCVSCHMPRIVYGVRDVHRSHRIEIPDPARDAAAGRPDACTSCHVAQDRTWAAAERRRLWGGPGPDPSRQPEPGTGGSGNPPRVPGYDAPLNTLLAGDPIARAVAADAIGRAPFDAGPGAGGGARAAAVRRGLLLDTMENDDYPAVRHLAWRALRRLGGDRPPAAGAYDATADGPERVRACAAIRAALPPGGAIDPDRAAAARLRAEARLVAIEIGE